MGHLDQHVRACVSVITFSHVTRSLVPVRQEGVRPGTRAGHVIQVWQKQNNDYNVNNGNKLMLKTKYFCDLTD